MHAIFDGRRTLMDTQESLIISACTKWCVEAQDSDVIKCHVISPNRHIIQKLVELEYHIQIICAPPELS